jgi:GNAT superfamily N-acetyltransferase
MAQADVPLGMRLSGEAGWNQTPDDWQRLLALAGDGAWVAECGGTPVGTTLICRFGTVAWVAMVLVDETFRGRGIGRALVERAIAFADAGGVTSLWLDATEAGRGLYEALLCGGPERCMAEKGLKT